MNSAPKRPRRSGEDRNRAATDAVSVTGQRRASEPVEQVPGSRDDARMETFEQSAVRRPEDSPDPSPSSLARDRRGDTSAADEP